MPLSDRVAARRYRESDARNFAQWDVGLLRRRFAEAVNTVARLETEVAQARAELAELRERRCETCRWWGPTGPKPKPRTSGHKTLWVGECLNAKQEPPGPQNGMWARADGCDDAGELYCEATHGCAAYERRAQSADADSGATRAVTMEPAESTEGE